MSEEHYKMKWSDDFALRDWAEGSGKMVSDPGYEKTICGQLRKLWVELNVKHPVNMKEVNKRIQVAYEMGKKMDKRLREQYLELNAGKDTPVPEDAL